MEKLQSVEYLVVHCSATRSSMNWTAKDVDRSHKERGFQMVGYHWVIRRDGRIEEGRPTQFVGAHEPRVNRRSLAICMIGGVAEDGWTPEANYTPEQYTTLRNKLQELKQHYPGATILGHRDIPGVKKACPCFDVRQWWRMGGATQPEGTGG